MSIKDAVEYIMVYCGSRLGCDGCPFNKNDYCYISNGEFMPCQWDLSELFNGEEEQ